MYLLSGGKSLFGTPWNSFKGSWRSLDHTLEINNLAQATPKGQHYRAHRDFLVCVTSPWRGFDSLKCFPQSENSTTQLDIALHHKVKALSLDPYKRCGLLSKTLWLRDSAQILTAYIFFLQSLSFSCSRTEAVILPAVALSNVFIQEFTSSFKVLFSPCLLQPSPRQESIFHSFNMITNCLDSLVKGV